MAKPTLKLGSKDPAVKELKTLLNKVVAPNPKLTATDDKVDAKTMDAVKAFQKSAGLRFDGLIGQPTWDALIKASQPVPQRPPPRTVPSKTLVRQTKTPQLDIEIYAEVLADGATNARTIQGKTNYDGAGVSYSLPTYQSGPNGTITSLTGAVTISGTVKIQTVYGPGANATQRSAYGRGTTPADEKVGDTSLGFHESCHREDFLAYLKTTPFPVSGARVGSSARLFNQAATAFRAAFAKYFTDMDKQSDSRTDEVGYKRSTWKAKGARKP